MNAFIWTDEPDSLVKKLQETERALAKAKKEARYFEAKYNALLLVAKKFTKENKKKEETNGERE